MENPEILDETVDVYINKPSLILRIKSTIIDGLVIILLMFLVSLILSSLNIESGKIRGVLFISILLYEPILVSLSRTLGQKIMGLRVRKLSKIIESNEKTNINIFSSLGRYFGKVFLGWISLLTIHSDKYGQAIHDKIGNSVMIIE